jgi:hypothetical protein
MLYFQRAYRSRNSVRYRRRLTVASFRYLSYILLLLTFPLLAIMPKDHPLSEPRPITPEQTGDIHTKPECRSVIRTVLHASIDQYRLLKIIFSSRNMRLAAAIFLVGTFRGISLRAFIQYASVRFDWKLSKASWYLIHFYFYPNLQGRRMV